MMPGIRPVAMRCGCDRRAMGHVAGVAGLLVFSDVERVALVVGGLVPARGAERRGGRRVVRVDLVDVALEADLARIHGAGRGRGSVGRFQDCRVHRPMRSRRSARVASVAVAAGAWTTRSSRPNAAGRCRVLAPVLDRVERRVRRVEHARQVGLPEGCVVHDEWHLKQSWDSAGGPAHRVLPRDERVRRRRAGEAVRAG